MVDTNRYLKAHRSKRRPQDDGSRSQWLWGSYSKNSCYKCSQSCVSLLSWEIQGRKCWANSTTLSVVIIHQGLKNFSKKIRMKNGPDDYSDSGADSPRISSSSNNGHSLHLSDPHQNGDLNSSRNWAFTYCTLLFEFWRYLNYVLDSKDDGPISSQLQRSVKLIAQRKRMTG